MATGTTWLAINQPNEQNQNLLFVISELSEEEMERLLWEAWKPPADRQKLTRVQPETDRRTTEAPRCAGRLHTGQPSCGVFVRLLC